jgi:hypothetical protein
VRRSMILVLPVLIAVVALAGCGSTRIAGSGGLGPSVAPIASAPPTIAAPSPTASHGISTKKPPPPYASTAHTYALDALDAYDLGETATIGLLSTAGGVTNFANLGHPDRHWHYFACGPDGTYTLCKFDNDNGDRIAIDIDPTLLGKPHAVREVVIDATEFATTADGDVNALVTAWADRNKYRMIALSDASTTSTLLADTAPPSWMLSDDTTKKPGDVVVTIQNTTTSDYEIDVTPSKLGHPHAMTMLLGD